MKVNKEEMLGMLVALERFVKLDHAALDREYQQRADVILKSLAGLQGVTAEHHRAGSGQPRAARADQAGHGRHRHHRSGRCRSKLREGTPSIGVRPGDELLVGVWMMEPGEEKVVARRLREVFEKKS